MNPDCQRKYEFNSHNKTVVLKVSLFVIVVGFVKFDCMTDPWSSAGSDC